MDADSDGEKESPDEDKGELGEGLSWGEVKESKVDAGIGVGKNEFTSEVNHRETFQVLQQQPSQGAVACWERFLHVRSIRVLLVEKDVSTRTVVTALLRNCNYEVQSAANGLQAWEILEDLNNQVDIVLTEVVMPGLSGINLLCKIMSHKTRKNIPVIMMSTQDSMGLVFQCLSKGAVDFLVKPVRKNELKTLWQHVWRRCHSSSGSGSESGTQTQKSVKSKGGEKSCHSESDGAENDESNGLIVGDGSDDGSGAQSSWTKQAAEADSSQAASPLARVADCQDSTCAQVIRSNAEHSNNKRVQISAEPEGHGQKPLDNVEKSKELEMIFQKNVEPKSENLVESQHDHIDDRECEFSRKVANKLDIYSEATDNCKEPNLELSLKRVRRDQDTGSFVQDDRFVLRRSEQSAFSRYSSPTNILKAQIGITGSSSIHDNSTEVVKRESICDMPGYAAGPVVGQSSNGISNNIDMGSTTNKLPKDKSEASASNRLHQSAFRPVKNDPKYSQQQASLLRNGIRSSGLLPARAPLPEQQTHHPHNHNNFHQESRPSSNHDESSLGKLATDASTDVLGGLMDDNPANNSLNRSGSGSNHGFSGHNRSGILVNNEGNNAESDGGQVGKSGSGDASGSGNIDDGKRLAQREAALIKFRQKRKERCFKKRVRYQNRQKIAEQRPRVRGQFVKQTDADIGSSRNEEQ